MGRDIHPQRMHAEYGNMTSGAGHWRVVKPKWYTGSPRSHHIGVHVLVMCEALGLTALPEGIHLTFIDGDKFNYAITNLGFGTGKERTAEALRVRLEKKLKPQYMLTIVSRIDDDGQTD